MHIFSNRFMIFMFKCVECIKLVSIQQLDQPYQGIVCWLSLKRPFQHGRQKYYALMFTRVFWPFYPFFCKEYSTNMFKCVECIKLGSIQQLDQPYQGIVCWLSLKRVFSTWPPEILYIDVYQGLLAILPIFLQRILNKHV